MILIFLVAGFATVYICGIAAYCKLFDFINKEES